MKIAVVIPCYKVVDHIEKVLAEIGSEVKWIICVDDGCPEGSGDYINSKKNDSRIIVLFHENNKGVGGATLTGFNYSIKLGADVIIKIDGDGQMDPSLIPVMVLPIKNNEADYTKGNRFYYVEDISDMPFIRVLGNLILSFMSKVSSGYWDLFDPSNGFLAIDAKVFSKLPISKISKDYFFESDMLFRLNILKAVVVEVPMRASYKDEQSNLKISKNIPIFFLGHLRNSVKRIFYNYYLRDFSIGSIALPFSILLTFFSLWFGIDQWLNSIQTGIPATTGTVFLSALPFIVGVQLFILFLSEDIARIPKYPIHKMLQKE